MISDALAEYGIVRGRANIRADVGPRNAVATGLCLSYVGSQADLAGTFPTDLRPRSGGRN